MHVHLFTAGIIIMIPYCWQKQDAKKKKPIMSKSVACQTDPLTDELRDVLIALKDLLQCEYKQMSTHKQLTRPAALPFLDELKQRQKEMGIYMPSSHR